MATRRPKRNPSWFLYLLECANGAVYTGIALDVQARFEQHRCGKGAKYTRANPPRRILATKRFRSRAAASREEWRVKQLTPAKKRALAKALRKALTLLLLLGAVPAKAAPEGVARAAPEGVAQAAPECIVRVAPGFNRDYALALNARHFKVITDPVVLSDDFRGFLSRYVKEGEYGILVGGPLRGGFELWAKGAEEPALARWRWFRGTERVIREELPLCADFLAGQGKP